MLRSCFLEQMVKKRMLHIDETGSLNGEENRERVCGCERGDDACDGGYVCSYFVEAMLCER